MTRWSPCETGCKLDISLQDRVVEYRALLRAAERRAAHPPGGTGKARALKAPLTGPTNLADRHDSPVGCSRWLGGAIIGSTIAFLQSLVPKAYPTVLTK